MRSPAVWLLVLALFVTPAFAADEVPKADAVPTAEEVAVPEADPDPEAEAESDGSLSATIADIEEYLAKQPIGFYGHIRLDMSRDAARTNDGNTAMWVEKQPDGDDDEFNMTARHTRFGMTYAAPESWGPKATAKIEFDFYGGSPENKAGVRLRHAYMNFQWGNGISLLAGQTWDLPGPYNMQKLNTAVGWNQGNSAFRRPQVRGTYTGKMGDKGKWDIALAIADPIARDIDGQGDDDGEDAGVPDFQWRASIAFPIVEIGLGGVFGKREADLVGHDDEYDTWLLGLDFLFPINKKWKILGEIYTSQAASSYNASLAQDYNTVEQTEIGAVGSFVNVVWKMNQYWTFVLGAGFCAVDEDDINAGDRQSNSTFFGNVRYNLTKQGWVGLEIDKMYTEYKDEDDFDNLRIQMTFALRF